MKAPRDRMMRAGRDYAARDAAIQAGASALARAWRNPDESHAVRPDDPEMKSARDVVLVLEALGLLK